MTREPEKPRDSYEAASGGELPEAANTAVDRCAQRRGSPGATLAPNTLEGQQHVEDLLAVARLLDVGDLAAAPGGNPRLGDLAGIDEIVALNVFGAHDAADNQFADLGVDPDLLFALDY